MGKFLKSWVEEIVVVLLKHGKLPDDATGYHPMSLLSTTHKLHGMGETGQ